MTTPTGFAASLRRWPRFLAARLDPKAYLGLHVTVGLGVAALALWLFGGLLEEVLDNATMVQWDQRAAAWIHATVTPAGVRVARLVTDLGSPPAMAAIAVVGVVAVLVLHRRLLAIAWVAAAAGGAILDQLLKLAIHRNRPVFGAAFLHRASYSFPSGHAMGAVIGYGMLAFSISIVRQLGRRARIVTFAIAAAGALLVGLSRIYLGVHFPSDVVGGWAAGAAWLSICITGYQVVTRRPGRRKPELP